MSEEDTPDAADGQEHAGDGETDKSGESEAESAIDPEAEAPLSSLRERVEAQRSRADSDRPISEIASQSVDGDELFEEVDVGDVDSEAVWEAVVEGDVDPGELLSEEPGDDEPAAEPTGTTDEHVIDKREYCQRCEFFTPPPNATCTNEGTEIVELVDSGHFRVRACPKVAADNEALSGFIDDEE
ncbi:MAG: hypothetical protein ACOCSD_06380 [Halolamina sp.]